MSKGPQDFLGRDLSIGCTLVYPTRTGSDMHLCKGRLMDLGCGPPGSDWVLSIESETSSGKKRTARNVPARRTVRVS